MSFAEPATVQDLLNYRLSCLLAGSGAMVTRLCEGRYGITRREWRLICILAAQGAMSPSALAEQAHLERARVSRHITDLVAKKLVVRQGVPDDKRRALVKLNERGRKLYDELFPQSVRFNNMVLQALTSTELAAFDVALTRLTDMTEELARSPLLTEKADRRHGGSRRFAEMEPDLGLW
ncbi:MAG: MarR family transcriptional regulator [Pseudomonadota bacterium]